MIHLKVVTPTRIFFCGDIKMCIARGVEGDLAIMRGTAKLVTPLNIGKLKVIFEDATEKIAAISDGYLTVADDLCTIVTDDAFWSYEVDVDEVNAEFDKFKKLIAEKNEENVSYEKKQLHKLIVRLAIAEEKES